MRSIPCKALCPCTRHLISLNWQKGSYMYLKGKPLLHSASCLTFLRTNLRERVSVDYSATCTLIPRVGSSLYEINWNNCCPNQQSATFFAAHFIPFTFHQAFSYFTISCVGLFCFPPNSPILACTVFVVFLTIIFWFSSRYP